MARSQVKVRAIIMAALTILLCLLFIIGSTFALFTDSDGKIGINATAGNLEVDIIDASDNPGALVGKTLNFVTTSAQDKILFEPGAAFYTQGFRVKNNGNIPLNFIIYISDDKETDADFLDAFEVWITDDPSRTIAELPDFDKHLDPGETSDVFYLVFRMKEDVGNEYQNRTFTGVGVTVCAVQGNVNID